MSQHDCFTRQALELLRPVASEPQSSSSPILFRCPCTTLCHHTRPRPQWGRQPQLSPPLTIGVPLPPGVAAIPEDGHAEQAMGTFRACISWWWEIQCLPLLHWIKCGVLIPFCMLPLWCSLWNYHLDNLQQEFVDSEVERLLKTSAICHAGLLEPLFTSLIGVVLKKNGKMWMIINMCLLNTFNSSTMAWASS